MRRIAILTMLMAASAIAGCQSGVPYQQPTNLRNGFPCTPRAEDQGLCQETSVVPLGTYL
jgi:hypothetical protein